VQAEVATTSGTTASFSSIRSDATRLTFMLDGVSLDGTESLILQLGDSGGLETSGYTSFAEQLGSSQSWASNTDAFHLQTGSAANDVWTGIVTLILMDVANNTWHCSGQLHSQAGTDKASKFTGVKSLSSTLTTLTLTSTNTPDNFDAGQIALLVE
jgi:hypothetical protein